MGYSDDDYGWNNDTQGGWGSDAAGPRSRPGQGSASGSRGQSGPSWRGQGYLENEPSGGWYQRDDYGLGTPSRPRAPQGDEPTRSSATYVPGGYGQPGGPSRPGYGQDGWQGGWGTDPYANRPFDDGYSSYGGYGQSSPRSQSWQAAPSRPLEQPRGAGPEWGPRSPWASQQMGELTTQGSSRWKLWVTLAVIAILLLAGTAGAMFAVQYFGPVGTVSRFCGALKGQSYSSAYGMLSNQYQSKITVDDFANDAVTLDQAEGSVLDCAPQSVGFGDNFHFGGSSVAFSLSIKRSSAGTLTGILHLTNESGSWKINALDTSLLGVNLGAIQAANTYCAALQSQAYSAAYGVLGKSLTSHLKGSDYAQQGHWHDQVDGSVSVCQVVGVNTGNSDTLASLSVSVTRSKLGKKQDVVSLDVENGAWKISAIGAQLQGTDIGGIQVTARFCSDLSHGNYTDLYGLLDGNFVGSASESYVAEVFDGAINGVKFTGCTLDTATYKLSGGTATLSADVTLLLLSTGRTANVPAKLKLVRYGHTWKVDDLTNS